MTGAREIADKLTEPMQKALAWLAQGGCYCDGRSLRALVSRGLAAHVASDPELLGDLYGITPRGIAVAAILQEKGR